MNTRIGSMVMSTEIIKHSLCGFCATRDHDQCTQKSQRFYMAIVKGKSVPTFIDNEFIQCTCPGCNKGKVK